MSIRACLMCLAAGDSLDVVKIEPLLPLYEALTGLREQIWSSYVCWECAAHLNRFQHMRQKSLRALDVINSLSVNGDELTQVVIEGIDREKYDFKSSMQISQLEYWESNCSLDIYENMPKIEIKEDENIKNMWLPEVSDIHLETKEENDCLDSFDEVFFSHSNDETDDEKPVKLSGEKSDVLLKSCGFNKLNKDLKGPRISSNTLKDAPSHTEPTMKTKNNKTKPRKKTITTRDKRIERFSKIVDVVPMTQEEAADIIMQRQDTSNYKCNPHKCDLCYKGFGQESTFKNHMQTHDPSIGAYECDLCRARFKSRRCLLKHICSRHRFKFCCRKCPSVCNTGNAARKHEAWHNGTLYVCKHCGAKFDYLTTMSNHVRIKHRQEFSCRFCGLCFVGSRGVTLHIIKVHDRHQVLGDGEHACDECDVNFVTLEALQRHRVLSAKHNLKETTKDPSNTSLLHKLLTQPRTADLRRGHSMMKDEDEVDLAKRKTTDGLKRIRKPSKENLMCEICGKVLQSMFTFRGHLRSHTSERPFKCTLCPKAFNVKNLREVHMQTHTREKRYRCDKCSRNFSSASNFTRHKRTVHTEAKPVQCNICNKLLKGKECLASHMKFVHLKEPYPVRKGKRKKVQEAVKSVQDSKQKLVE